LDSDKEEVPMALASKVKPIPDTYRRVTPALTVRGGTKALAFYKVRERRQCLEDEPRGLAIGAVSAAGVRAVGAGANESVAELDPHRTFVATKRCRDGGLGVAGVVGVVVHWVSLLRVESGHPKERIAAGSSRPRAAFSGGTRPSGGSRESRGPSRASG
jgi:hypothetical protein